MARKKKKSSRKKKGSTGIPRNVRKASSVIKKHLTRLQAEKKREEAALKKTNSQINELKRLV